jgi:FkbM family methyltransferase
MQIASLWRLFLGTRTALRNWPTTATVGCLVSPSRFLPEWNPLAKSRLADKLLDLDLRNGLRIRCKASEFPPFLEAFVVHAYDLPGIRWNAVETIVDIGANVGMATLWLATVAPGCRIVAVEPSPEAAGRLRSNIARNALSSRVTVIEAAVGATDGDAVLDVGGQSPTARLRDDGSGVKVRLMTLRQVLDHSKIERLDVLKMDCEGAEYEILETAGPVLDRVGAIVGEFHLVTGRHPQDLARILTSAGFSVRLTADRAGLGTIVAQRFDASMENPSSSPRT